MKDYRLEKLADLLVNYATEVKKGDKVCISGEEASIPFLIAVAKAAIKRGGQVQYFVDLPEIEEILLKNGTKEQICQPNFRFGECAKSDVWISAWGSRNVKTLKNIEAETLKWRRMGNYENRQIYNQRSASGELRWCGTQFPTDGDAQYAEMSLEEYENFVYAAGFLDQENPVVHWKLMEENQQKWVEYLDEKKELHIISKGTDLKVGIEGKKWINCCGKENFPDGEIFTSPCETKIDGKITFSYPALMNGDAFEQVELLVKQGQILSAKCKEESQISRLLSYLDTDEGSRRFGEVAIGTNYGIRSFTRNILFDEKMGGTMHMAVGAAMGEAGGKNVSAIHWDMINDMTKQGKIYADGQLFYENGKFLESVLEKKQK